MQRFKLVLEILAALAAMIGLVIAFLQYRQSTVQSVSAAPPATMAPSSDPAVISSETTSNTDASDSFVAPVPTSDPPPPALPARPQALPPPPAIHQQDPVSAPRRALEITLRTGEQKPVLGERVGLAFQLQELGTSRVPVLSITPPDGETEDYTYVTPRSRPSFTLDGSQWSVFVLEVNEQEGFIRLRLAPR